MLKNENFSIIFLDWDTEMFKKKSAKIVLYNEISDEDLRKIKEYIYENNYEFVTIENKNNNAKNNIILSKLDNLFLADVNIQFAKKVEKLIEKQEFIKITNAMKYNEDIINMSRNAFKNSRFIFDERLNDNKYDVYSEWARNAFEKEDKYYCYYTNNGKIEGYVLFSIHDKTITIELITTIKKCKGVGTKLISQVENYAFMNGLDTLNVGTQLNNLNAQNFYEKNGFRHVENNSIYHWWINKKI